MVSSLINHNNPLLSSSFILFGEYEIVQELFSFLCKACYASFSFAHRIIWFLKASIGNDASANDKIKHMLHIIQTVFKSESNKDQLDNLYLSGSQEYINYLSQENIQKCYFNNSNSTNNDERSSEFIEARNKFRTALNKWSELLYEKELVKQGIKKSETIISQENQQLRSNLVQELNEFNPKDICLSLFRNYDFLTNDEESIHMQYVKQIDKDDVNLSSFLSNINFIDHLCNICDVLLNTVDGNRKKTLLNEIMKINKTLPANVYIPFINHSIRNYVVAAIPISEAKIFKTKERAPYMLTLECFRLDELNYYLLKRGVDSELVLTQSALSTSSNNNMHSISSSNSSIHNSNSSSNNSSNSSSGDVKDSNKYQKIDSEDKKKDYNELSNNLIMSNNSIINGNNNASAVYYLKNKNDFEIKELNVNKKNKRKGSGEDAYGNVHSSSNSNQSGISGGSSSSGSGYGNMKDKLETLKDKIVHNRTKISEEMSELGVTRHGMRKYSSQIKDKLAYMMENEVQFSKPIVIKHLIRGYAKTKNEGDDDNDNDNVFISKDDITSKQYNKLDLSENDNNNNPQMIINTNEINNNVILDTTNGVGDGVNNDNTANSNTIIEHNNNNNTNKYVQIEHEIKTTFQTPSYNAVTPQEDLQAHQKQITNISLLNTSSSPSPNENSSSDPESSSRSEDDPEQNIPSLIDQIQEQEQNSSNMVHSSLFGETLHQKTSRLRRLSPFGKLSSYKLFNIIIKSGEDLRQEQFATQLINEFLQIFKFEKVKCWLQPYEIIATGTNVGIVEVVPNSISIDQMKRKNKSTLNEFYQTHFGPVGSQQYKRAMKNYIQSLAGYSLVCYFLQIKDRHNANILIDDKGHLIHIDFGFMLSNAPGKGLKFERAPFKLTNELVDVMGGTNTKYFNSFRKLLWSGFNALVEHYEKILILVEMMYCGHGNKLPCFEAGQKTIAELRQRFIPRPNMKKRDYMEHVDQLISQSLDNWRTNWYDKFQYILQGILP